jgi:hypothetical protein
MAVFSQRSSTVEKVIFVLLCLAGCTLATGKYEYIYVHFLMAMGGTEASSL